ncbi:hypothetical protein M758_8G122000 [Ceratodon purpureus]|uniref:Uncharacterized protein n=1 Tax=Ceratodon purpureus TaxID=3225 RepID=A0A8T0H0J5_CERPU|nr:hypothetical protein KC19_8G127600 [Ceratodon purpureus]KAG0608653.1 hypothetical protein M758_8G122000 [Ceratodon purpureus]
MTAFGEQSPEDSMVYDISTNSWEILLKDPWSPLSIYDPCSWLDKPMNLILPACILREKVIVKGKKINACSLQSCMKPVIMQLSGCESFPHPSFVRHLETLGVTRLGYS